MILTLFVKILKVLILAIVTKDFRKILKDIASTLMNVHNTLIIAMKMQIAMIIMENFNVSAKPVSSCGGKNILAKYSYSYIYTSILIILIFFSS